MKNSLLVNIFGQSWVVS